MRLLAVLLALSAPAVAVADEPKLPPLDDDFEADVPVPSLALGPVPRGSMMAGGSVGWLRSDLEAHLGLGYWLDISVRADAMVLYQGLGAQNTLYAGVRVSPISEGTARLTLSIEAGEVFAPVTGATKTFPVLRGEIAGGLAIRPVTVYARLAVRGASSDSLFIERWALDTEAGVGLEGHVTPRLLVGAEVYAWARERVDRLWQWRLRVGWAI